MKNNHQHNCEIVLIVSVLSILMAPSVCKFLGIEPHPIKGDRVAFLSSQKKAESSWEGFKVRLSSDYGLRGSLLNANGLLEERLIKTNQNGVMFGKEDWKFMNREGLLEYTQRLEPLTPIGIENVLQQLQINLSICKQYGVDYVRVIAPEKSTIYPEYLPIWVQPAFSESRFEQLLATQSSVIYTVLPDTRIQLLNVKMDYQVYFKADSHWNSRGAVATLNTIYNHLNTVGLHDYPFIEWDAFEEKCYSMEPDLYRFMGLFSGYEAIDCLPNFPHFKENTIVYNFPEQVLSEHARFPRTLLDYSENFRYTTYAWNPEERVRDRRVVLVGDSFAEYLPPLLKHHFSEVIFIHERELPIPEKWLERFEPQLLIELSAERKLLSPPQKLISTS
jgi:alginate O-acetyltransferase complex protein AlgJ